MAKLHHDKELFNRLMGNSCSKVGQSPRGMLSMLDITVEEGNAHESATGD